MAEKDDYKPRSDGVKDSSTQVSQQATVHGAAPEDSSAHDSQQVAAQGAAPEETTDGDVRHFIQQTREDAEAPPSKSGAVVASMAPLFKVLEPKPGKERFVTKEYVDNVTEHLEQKMENQRNDFERQLDDFRVQVQQKDTLIQSLQTKIMDLQLELQRSRDEVSNERARRTAIEILYKERKKHLDDNAESYKQRMEKLGKEINQWVIARGELVHKTKLAEEEREYVHQYLGLWKRTHDAKDKYIELCHHELLKLQKAKEIMAEEVTKTWEEMEV